MPVKGYEPSISDQFGPPEVSEAVEDSPSPSLPQMIPFQPAAPRSILPSVDPGTMIPKYRMEDAEALAGEPSKEKHAAQEHEFNALEAKNRGDMLALDPKDPQYRDKLANYTTRSGVIKAARAHYAQMTPWGTPESAHPGVLGKIGHGLGVAGNIAGETFAPQVMPSIPGSQANLEKQVGEGEGEIAEAGKEGLQAAQAEEQSAQASQAPSEIAEREAQTKKLGEPPAPTEAMMDKDVLGAGTRIASGKGTPDDLALVQAYHQLQQLKQKTVVDRPDTPEQQFIDDYMKRNEGATVEDAIAAYAKLSRPEKPSTGDARSDKSYQYNQNRLDKIRKPIDDTVARFSRLQETMNQHSPQADALVAPELLTVMAGGQGSGLRMNEAEISRIVGGRSVWENLKAHVQRWNLDPNEARSITPDQDRQIRALIDAVGKKLSTKQAILESAQRNLLASDDPKEHRQIMANAQQQLDTMDAGAGGAAPNIPPGATHIYKDKNGVIKGYALNGKYVPIEGQ